MQLLVLEHQNLGGPVPMVVAPLLMLVIENYPN